MASTDLPSLPIPQLTIWGPSTNVVMLSLNKDEISIGRAPNNDVVLADDRVSRRHLTICRTPSGFTVEDLGSRHGTTLNGAPLHGSAPLGSGARIGLGRTTLLFDVTSAHAEATRSWQGEAGNALPVLIGRSKAIAQLRDTIARVATAMSPVLILGESGTGKEVVARLIHHTSPRRRRPFVVVNCPALPGNLIEAELFGIEKNVATGVNARPGKLEETDGGTVFLDELGDLAPEAQAKLLRFLADHQIERVGGRKQIPVDVRVVAATHHDLAGDVAAGRFRLDLLYRLNTLVIHLPPLRDRREDIPLLVELFLSRQPGPKRRVDPTAMELLCQRSFPGNVRELEAIVARAAILHDDLVLGPEAFGLSPDVTAMSSASAATEPSPLGVRSDDPIAELRRRMERGESFWVVVHAPFLRRMLGAETVRNLVHAALAEAGGSYRKMAANLGVTDLKEYKKFTDFLRHHDLKPRDP